jgi:hypothetical protein
VSVRYRASGWLAGWLVMFTAFLQFNLLQQIGETSGFGNIITFIPVQK